MNTEHNSSGQQLESEQSRDLTQLKKQIELTNLQLLELTHNDEKFINHINQLNAKGVQCVNTEEHKQAVVYFNQCEKILEYAASCGKTIDRSIIVVTLHNQACVNQKLWDLEKSANYLEAIIYNINFYFETTRGEKKYREQLQEWCTFIHKKNVFALYHLQFCAVNSQIRKHAISLASAKTAIRIMREVCQELALLSQKNVLEDLEEINFARANQTILKNLASCEEELVINDYQKYFSVVKQLMSTKERNISGGEDEYKNVRNFSIGKLMQLTPITINEVHCRQTPKDWLKLDSIITLALYLGVSFFTVGTELRFISCQNCDEGNQVYKLSEDFLISEVYHIYSIMIVLKYVPVRSIFLNHLLTSFNSHYEIDLEKIFVAGGPEMKSSKKKEGQIFSYASSQDLGLAASTLPQESALKHEMNRVQQENQTPVKNEEYKPEMEERQKIKSTHSGLQLHDHYRIQNVGKVSRTKSPRLQEKTQSKSKKQDHKSKSRKKSRGENLKTETLIHLNRRLENTKNEQSIKNRSKTKSDFQKSTSTKKKNSGNKYCIYTTKIKKDFQIESKQKNDNEKTITKKSKSKQRSNKKQIKSTNKTIQIDQKRKSLSKQKQKPLAKEKEKAISRNLIGRLQKKLTSPGRNSIKQIHSKNKTKGEKLKMKRVQASKH